MMLKHLLKPFRKDERPVLSIEPEGEAVCFAMSGPPQPAEAWVTSPPEGSSALDRQRCGVLAQWAMDGLAELAEARVTAPTSMIYLAEEGDLRALELAPPCRLRFSLHALGSLHEPEFGYELRLSHADGAPAIGFVRRACFLDNGAQRYLLSRDQHDLLTGLERFRERPPSERTYEHHLAAFAKLKETALALNAELDRYMEKETALVASRMGVELVELGPDELEVRPSVPGTSPEALADALDRVRQVPPVMTLHAAGGDRQRVVVEPEVQAGLAQIKQVRRLRGKSRRAFLSRPQDFLDPGVIDLGDFSERVKGIGQFQIRYYPLIERSGRNWIPDRIGMVIDSDDPTEPVATLAFESLAEFEPLEAAYQEAVEEQEPTFRWQDRELPIDGDTEPTLRAIREALTLRENVAIEEEAPPPEEPTAPEESEDDRVFLLIHTNVDGEEYQEDLPSEEDALAMVRPEALKPHVQLLKHQAEGIAWMQSRFNEGQRGVILADDMGLGKTIQVLTFLAWYAQEAPEPRPILVVAPVALLENWQEEYEKFLDPVLGAPLALHGPQLAQFRIAAGGREYQDGGRKVLDTEAIARHRLVLTTYEAVRDYQFSLASIHWGVVVTDEAQKIKTPGALVTNAAKALKTDFRIVATGTPVENSLVDLWCLADFAQPGLLGALKTFRSRYDQPRQRQAESAEAHGRALREALGRAFLRRLKADILTELPSRNEHEVVIPMSPTQASAYLETAEAYRRGPKGKGSVLSVLRSLRGACVHPALAGEDEAAIDVRSLSTAAPKLHWVLTQLERIRAKGEKCVLFTEDRRLQRVLAQVVRSAFGITPSIVNGEVPGVSRTDISRKSLIDAFQRQAGFHVIILSPVAVGFGLTITAANHVIHVTRLWNPAKEDQATDRVHRIGQTRPVEIYYPIAADPHGRFQSFDQILATLLGQKRSLARNVLFPTQDLDVDTEGLANLLLASPHGIIAPS